MYPRDHPFRILNTSLLHGLLLLLKNQFLFRPLGGIVVTEVGWLVGSFDLADRLSVCLSVCEQVQNFAEQFSTVLAVVVAAVLELSGGWGLNTPRSFERPP